MKERESRIKQGIKREKKKKKTINIITSQARDDGQSHVSRVEKETMETRKENNPRCTRKTFDVETWTTKLEAKMVQRSSTNAGRHHGTRRTCKKPSKLDINHSTINYQSLPDATGEIREIRIPENT